MLGNRTFKPSISPSPPPAWPAKAWSQKSSALNKVGVDKISPPRSFLTPPRVGFNLRVHRGGKLSPLAAAITAEQPTRYIQ